jgi:hypothetical protein
MSRSTSSKGRLRSVPAAIARLVGGMLVSGSEMVLAVALVVVLALAFMGILMLSFPRGVGLSDLYTDFVGEQGVGRGREWQRDGGGNAPFVAILTEVQRKVRDRPASAIAWNQAYAGMRLEEQHTVQTLAHSAAAIRVGETGNLRLGERSLVVIKRDDEQRGLRRRRTSVVLLGGRVDGNIAARGGKSSRLNIVTVGGTAALRSTSGQGTEFSVATNADESSTVAIYTGTAEITAGGESMRVGPNEAITFDESGLPVHAAPIPTAPELLSPPDGRVQVFGSVAPRVRFRWAGPDDADAYRFVLARDRDLNDVVWAGELSRPEFAHGNLPSGRYFWSVKSVSGRAESRASVVNSLRLDQDLEPPELHVELPQEAVPTERLVIRGMAEPGSELFIKNRTVPLGASGAFEYTMKLKPGLNMIVIEAVDQAGNSAYRSQYVTARFDNGGGS